MTSAHTVLRGAGPGETPQRVESTSTSRRPRPDSASGGGSSGWGRRSPLFKSSYSSGNSCVEIAVAPRPVHVRDSKHDTVGPRLAFTPATWTAFVSQT